MVARDSNSASMTIRCTGAEAIHAMVVAAQDFVLQRGLETGHGARLVIIVEELVTNLVEHGGISADGLIELVLTQEDAVVGIALSDSGIAFDPRSDDGEGEIPDRGGGAGIDLIKAWAEIVDYESHGGQNRLLLKMWLS
jgi:anti-sigma regulatory factor (Ser/Thr protein kinase)